VTLAALLLRQSEGGEPAILWGRQAKPHFGREFERLLNHGILIEQAPATDWDVCADCECGMTDRPIRRVNGLLVAACPFDHKQDETLEPEDIRSFAINTAALVHEIATKSGFEAPSEFLPGAWHVGLTPTKRALFVVVSRAVLLLPGFIAAIRLEHPSAPISVLGPTVEAADRLLFAEAGIHLVPIVDALAKGSSSLALDLACLTPPNAVTARLVIDAARAAVVLDGKTIVLAPQPFELLKLLAERAIARKPAASNRDIEERIWAGQVHKLSREARDVVRELRDALGADRRLVENSRNQGWQLTLAPTEIQIRP